MRHSSAGTTGTTKNYSAGILGQSQLLATTFHPTHPPRGGVELAYRKDAADPIVLHFPSRATLITPIYPRSSVMLYYCNLVYRVYEYRLQRLSVSPNGGCGRTRTSGRTGKSKLSVLIQLVFWILLVSLLDRFCRVVVVDCGASH